MKKFFKVFVSICIIVTVIIGIKDMIAGFKEGYTESFVDNVNKGYVQSYNEKAKKDNKPLLDENTEYFDNDGFLKLNLSDIDNWYLKFNMKSMLKNRNYGENERVELYEDKKVYLGYLNSFNDIKEAGWVASKLNDVHFNSTLCRVYSYIIVKSLEQNNNIKMKIDKINNKTYKLSNEDLQREVIIRFNDENFTVTYINTETGEKNIVENGLELLRGQ